MNCFICWEVKCFTAKMNACFSADLTFKDFSRINCCACECVCERERISVSACAVISEKSK